MGRLVKILGAVRGLLGRAAAGPRAGRAASRRLARRAPAPPPDEQPCPLRFAFEFVTGVISALGMQVKSDHAQYLEYLGTWWCLPDNHIVNL